MRNLQIAFWSMVLGASPATAQMPPDKPSTVTEEAESEQAPKDSSPPKPEPSSLKTPPVLKVPPPVIISAPSSPVMRSSRRKDYAVTPSADGKTLHLAGKINSGITTAFKEAIKKHPAAKTVVLSSNGGMIIEGLALANVIRKHGLNTHSEFVCASACTFAFLAGKERSIAPTASIGFHQSSKPSLFAAANNDSPKYVAGDEVMRTVYADAGLDAPFIDTALKTPPTDMWFPAVAELLGKKIATRTSLPDEFSVPVGNWKSGADLVATLGADPVFKAAQMLKPNHYLRAASEAWTAAAVGTDSAAERRDVMEVARTTLVRQLVADADQYDDALLANFIAAEQSAWAAKSSGLNPKCDALFGMGFPVDPNTKGDLRKRQDAVLLEMIGTAVEKRVPSTQRLNEAEAVLIEFWGQMISEQSFDGLTVGNAFCKEPGHYYDVLASLPVAKRASVFRTLALTALRQSGLPRLPFL